MVRRESSCRGWREEGGDDDDDDDDDEEEEEEEEEEEAEFEAHAAIALEHKPNWMACVANASGAEALSVRFTLHVA